MAKIVKPHILFVCSKNLWRSPTAEHMYQTDDRIEVRSAGTSRIAKHRISTRDVEWADLIICMEEEHRERIQQFFPQMALPLIKVLNFEDVYPYMNPELIEILKPAVEAILSDYFRTERRFSKSKKDNPLD